jgi:hypothetical protein
MTAPTDDLFDFASDATWSTGPATGFDTKGATPPTAGEISQGMVPGVGVRGELVNATLDNFRRWLAHSSEDVARGIYGNGSDGDVVISGGTETLTRVMYYDNLTIEGDGILDCAGFYPHVRNVCQIDEGGIMRRNGNVGGDSPGSGTGGDAAAALSGGILGGSGAGGAGVDSGTGLNGGAVTNALGGRGSEGGEGNEGDGGNGGSATDPDAADGGWNHVTSHPGYIVGPSGFTRILGGGGGGGGSEGVGAAGGGGGSGGGVLALIAFDLQNEGTIQANGGRGGSASGGSAGAGGGGGGGCIFLVTRRKSGSGTVEAAVGADGAVGTASTTPGTAGEIIELVA